MSPDLKYEYIRQDGRHCSSENNLKLSFGGKMTQLLESLYLYYKEEGYRELRIIFKK